MTVYNHKGDISAKQTYNVSDVQKSGGVTTALLNTEMVNDKGKTMSKSKATVQCDGGVMKMDMKLSLPSGQNGAPGSTNKADVKTDNYYVEYPSSMNVGDNLKDASMKMDIDNTSGIKQSVTLDITNRKVEAKEDITTPAGKWNCYKISFKSNMKVKTMGIGVPIRIDGTEWFAPGFGIVKTESKYGKTEITAVK